MPEVPYSKREQDEKFNNLATLIRDKHDDVMVAMGIIRVQTTATNGQVRWQEKMIYCAIGGLSVLSITLLPAVGWLFVQTINNSNHMAAIYASLKN